MPEYHFGALKLDPVKNPAVLDTATWDPQAAWGFLRAVPASCWPGAIGPQAAGEPPRAGLEMFADSSGAYAGAEWVLARLADGQHLLLAAGRPAQRPCPPLGELALPNGNPLLAFPASAESIEWMLRRVLPERGPRALGPVPRLGIGTRMSAAVWPGVWPALKGTGAAANAIQNSVRELNLLEDLTAGRPPRSNYMFGFGALSEGHTGSTFEGLWLAGVLDALRAGFTGPFGADADHIMVKRGPDGLERARQVIRAARRYSFFTLDVSDVLDYPALAAGADLEQVLPDAGERREVLAFHVGRLEKRALAGAAAKHWAGLAAVEALAATIRELKGDAPFDLELSIDETPPGIRALDCLTTEAELAFLLGEIRRRGLPVTHVAPNFGVEKGSDYLGADGLPGLEARAAGLHRLAEAEGILLDCHSGDDLKPETRRAVGRAMGGRVHFKISPMLQELFAEVLHSLYPERFRFWWEDAVAYAARSAEGGSELAVRCLREVAKADAGPSPASALFHYYGFATVGRRGPDGSFLFRDRFYDLPPAFYAEYARRTTALLCEVAADVLGQ